ncbi:putative flippase GtrA [Bacillus pakistanensis]|uniref:Flippase GtrA n=1 Tax=Rossellomorea pakistanensis TaxID=992288 RepID=A0ABS2NCC1_9BACI|nr:GtrA family protein [Bacillus pakistanensis]MBM7585509.1 putative flippase GtrA [Bacillus pakistanensis]
MSHIALIIENCLKRTNSFTRFLMVGVVNTLTGLSIMLLLLNVIGLSYWFSTFLGNGSGAVVSYFLNRSFTFQSKVQLKSSAFRFLTVILVCYLLSYSLSRAVADFLVDFQYIRHTLPEDNLAILIGTGFYTLTNYLAQKHFVFKT